MTTVDSYASFVMSEAGRFGGDWERALQHEIAYAIEYGMDVMRDTIITMIEGHPEEDLGELIDDIKALGPLDIPTELDPDDVDEEPFENELVDDDLFDWNE
jgi:hypothetical protein